MTNSKTMRHLAEQMEKTYKSLETRANIMAAEAVKLEVREKLAPFGDISLLLQSGFRWVVQEPFFNYGWCFCCKPVPLSALAEKFLSVVVEAGEKDDRPFKKGLDELLGDVTFTPKGFQLYMGSDSLFQLHPESKPLKCLLEQLPNLKIQLSLECYEAVKRSSDRATKDIIEGRKQWDEQEKFVEKQMKVLNAWEREELSE